MVYSCFTSNLKTNRMNHLLIKVFVCLLISNFSYTQQKQKNYKFKKGEVLDILLLSTYENSKEQFDRYKKTAFPVAFEYTYEPQPGFLVKKLVLGNHFPSSLIIGKWSSKEKREGFLENIVNRVPDFHEQRRNLFKYFGLTYYVMKENIEFAVDAKKINTANAFWGKDNHNSIKFHKDWEQKVKASGGNIVLKLEKGISPVGYNYNPDVFYIIAWKNEQVLKNFSKNNPLTSYESLKNVHQFVIK